MVGSVWIGVLMMKASRVVCGGALWRSPRSWEMGRQFADTRFWTLLKIEGLSIRLGVWGGALVRI